LLRVWSTDSLKETMVGGYSHWTHSNKRRSWWKERNVKTTIKGDDPRHNYVSPHANHSSPNRIKLSHNRIHHHHIYTHILVFYKLQTKPLLVGSPSFHYSSYSTPDSLFGILHFLSIFKSYHSFRFQVNR
jgi:hypothetical protein